MYGKSIILEGKSTMRHTLDPEIIRRLDNLTQMQRLA